ncbi:MAG TPA: acyl-CoA-binding protein [Dongiaceae bacterium]|nr:acyl-CoA-binding protein [Dongiaceae bacterium]
MGKLKDMVSEPVSLADRLKINAKRVRLAGIGLFSKMDAERARLYQQIVDMGQPYGDEASLVGRLSVLGTGTVHLVLEESQKLFDDLVEAGELALAKESVRPLAHTGRINTPRPVAKSVAPKLVSTARPAAAVSPNRTETAKPAAQAAPKAAAKPALKEVVKAAASADAVSEELKQHFAAAKARLNTLTAPPDQFTMLALYALFKQANEGDVSGRRPAVTKMVDRAKFDERQKIKGMTAAEAMERYIAKVNSLFPA